MRKESGPRVGLVGGFGGENLGNDASAAAVIRSIAQFGDVQPVLLVDGPPTSHLGGGIESVVMERRQHKVRWRHAAALRDLVRISRVPASLDSVVVAGGGVFEAEGTRGSGSAFAPAALLVLALGTRLRRKPFVLHAIGGTFMPSRSRRFLMRWTGRLATRRTFRDRESRDALVRMGGARRTDVVVPDVAFVLAPTRDASEGAPSQEDDRTHRVVVGVMGYAWLDDADRPDGYEDALVGLVVRLLAEERTRVAVVLGDVADRAIAARVAKAAAAEAADAAEGRITMPGITTFDDLVDAMQESDLVVCSRFHNVVAALIAGTPVVAVTDRSKVRSLMTSAGLGSYVLDARSVTAPDLERAAAELASSRAEVSQAARAWARTASAEAWRDAAELARHLGLPERRHAAAPLS